MGGKEGIIGGVRFKPTSSRARSKGIVNRLSTVLGKNLRPKKTSGTTEGPYRYRVPRGI